MGQDRLARWVKNAVKNEYYKLQSDEKSVFWKIFQLHDNKLFNTTLGIFYE